MEASKEEGTPVEKTKRNSILNFFKMGEVGEYFFRSKDKARPSNFNIKMMHGINKFSIIIFLAAIIYLVLKRFL